MPRIRAAKRYSGGHPPGPTGAFHPASLPDCRHAGEKESGARALDQSIDTTDATGRLIFHVLGSISQFETEIRAERQMEGILKAKANGVQFGRSKQLKEKEILELQQRRENGALIRELMVHYQLSKASIYRYLVQDME